ncbi:DNA-3-methyladenine glycosylase I [Rothia nasimurium]|uniref:DNA-3-methyladenine glycosylase I n=1 Tax=Rothia nasimurium TaxID=85336 RepID=UPI003BA3CCB7
MLTENPTHYPRPSWVRGPASQAYWETEWQMVPRTDQDLFEHLCLLIFQNGLPWEVVLKKREVLKSQFFNFEIPTVAAMTPFDCEQVMQAQGGIRNSSKIRAVVHNARMMTEKSISLCRVLGEAIPHTILIPPHEEMPVRTAATDSVSQSLKAAGLVRVGPVVCSALAQAAGYIRWENYEN